MAFCGGLFASCCGGVCLHPDSVVGASKLMTCRVLGRSKDSLYDPILADSEREAVSDLLGYLENVCFKHCIYACHCGSSLD